MKKKLYFVANFHFNMEDNVYAYNSYNIRIKSSFGDIGKVLHLPLSGFSFMQCKKKTLGNARPIEDVSVTEKEIILNIQKGLRYFTEEDSWLHKSIQSIQKT